MSFPSLKDQQPPLVWMELTPATPEIHHLGLQAGESKAGDGIKGLFRQGSGWCKCQSWDWKEMEG